MKQGVGSRAKNKGEDQKEATKLGAPEADGVLDETVPTLESWARGWDHPTGRPCPGCRQSAQEQVGLTVRAEPPLLNTAEAKLGKKGRK